MAERILRRVGVVLFLSGLLDLLLLGVHIATHTGYQASWFLPGMIGGVLLYRGSLRTVSIARQIGAFLIAVGVVAILTIPFLQPFGLLVARLQHAPAAALMAVVWSIAWLALLVWIMRQLDHEAVRSAMMAAGWKRRGLRVAACMGCTVTLVLFGLTAWSGHTAAAAHARQLAEEQTGPGYSYFVRSTNLLWRNGVQHGDAIVDAWNDTELRQVAVEWPQTAAAWEPHIKYDPAFCREFSLRCEGAR